jgi:hypothetical protein
LSDLTYKDVYVLAANESPEAAIAALQADAAAWNAKNAGTVGFQVALGQDGIDLIKAEWPAIHAAWLEIEAIDKYAKATIEDYDTGTVIDGVEDILNHVDKALDNNPTAAVKAHYESQLESVLDSFSTAEIAALGTTEKNAITALKALLSLLKSSSSSTTTTTTIPDSSTTTTTTIPDSSTATTTAGGPVSDPVREFYRAGGNFGFRGFNEFDTLLYLQWLLDENAPSLYNAVRNSAEYHNFVIATDAIAAEFHSATVNGYTVEVSGLEWWQQVVISPVSSGTAYNGALGYAGSQSVVASLSIGFVDYSYSGWLSGSLGTAAVTQYPLYSGLGYGYAGSWGAGLYSYRSGQLVNTPGFVTVTLTYDGLKNYKDFSVLDVDYRYVAVKATTITSTKISFRINHAGHFVILGTKTSDNPATADGTHVALYSMMALASLAGVAIVNRKRAARQL